MELDFLAEWLNHLLKGIEKECLFAECANFHYHLNKMDDKLEAYIGDLDGFLSFLTETYGWQITRSEDGKTITVDENKEYCVCPVANQIKGDVSHALCYCSESYAKKMFSKVCQKEVQAKVLRSYVRDGKSCIYEIQIG